MTEGTARPAPAPAPAPGLRRLRFTRDGAYFVAITLGVGFAAINTANNLLFLVLGLLLALIVASGVLSELTLRRVQVRRQLPQRLHAGQPALIELVAQNGKHRFASYALSVAEPAAAERAAAQRCYFLKLEPGAARQAAYRRVFPRRGRQTLPSLVARTRFPFGLFDKARQVGAAQEVLVYPAVTPIVANERPLRERGEGAAAHRDRAGEFHALREYRAGDDPRDIAWRKSAGLGRAVVREHESPRARRITVFLDNRRLLPANVANDALQERAVSRAASLATHYGARGHPLALVSHTVEVPAGSGPAQTERILRELALIAFVAVDQEGMAGGSGSDTARLRDWIYVGPELELEADPQRTAEIRHIADEAATERQVELEI
ncbi:MAG: DUF58 domain-containing protein [Proteobacteria bacterium]|nr:DUF58 domain-containing protein [Pseudomonadota bacterium]